MEDERKFNAIQEGSMYLPSDEVVFRWYMNDFQLTPEDLKAKVILDLGAGDNANFAHYCKDHGLAERVYSLDRRKYLSLTKGHTQLWKWKSDADRERHITERNKSLSKKGYVTGTGQELPFKEGVFDLVLARAAINNPNSNLENLFSNVIRSLKGDGEFRIVPFLSKNEVQKVQDVLRAIEHRDTSFEYRWVEGHTQHDAEISGRRDMLVIRKREHGGMLE